MWRYYESDHEALDASQFSRAQLGVWRWLLFWGPEIISNMSCHVIFCARKCEFELPPALQKEAINQSWDHSSKFSVFAAQYQQNNPGIIPEEHWKEENSSLLSISVLACSLGCSLTQDSRGKWRFIGLLLIRRWWERMQSYPHRQTYAMANSNRTSWFVVFIPLQDVKRNLLPQQVK